MSAFPAPSELTSHQPPALLVAELLAATADGHAGRTRLANAAGLDVLQLVEGCAQSLAVLMGYAARIQGGARASGMLVGVKDVVSQRPALPGEIITVEAELAHELGAFRLYTVRVSDAHGALVLSAELKTMATGASAHAAD